MMYILYRQEDEPEYKHNVQEFHIKWLPIENR